jgi:antitoxin (DNA-binding transcriptional repressor) of toxin-antitoxin stability system
MPHTVTIEEAAHTFADLVRRVETGEQIVIARGETPIALLTNYERARLAAKRRAALGWMEGKFPIPPNDVLIGPRATRI